MSTKSMKIGDFCREKLLEGKTQKQVVKLANKRKNGKKVNLKHTAWYIWDLRKRMDNDELPAIYQK